MKSSLLVVLALLVSSAESFANIFGVPRYRTAAQSSLTKCPDDASPIPFLPSSPTSLLTPIEIYPTCTITHSSRTFHIGTPCDNSISICRFSNEDDSLIPLEDSDPEFDNVVSVAGKVIEEEFGEDLQLVKTCGVLTLCGEIDWEEDEEQETEAAGQDDEEEVEMLLAFEYDNREYNVVRMVDPVMLVGEESASGEVRLIGEDGGEVLEEIEKIFLEEGM
ncbi:hypothetical protein TrLO_g15308 [Triparma laevis f. longispina]|uniref:Uncharacterized protein n=1 Tax=Triparma laevis f. longispina TaxID=1714387 RepID=A0A9W7KYY3_9STRA|nr:hypothetical protein TrLO_g15308 [Triparma laevis f. longispina]